MRKREFNNAMSKLHRLDRARFGTLFDNHLDADRDWIHFERDRAGFYLNAERSLQERLWELVRG